MFGLDPFKAIIGGLILTAIVGGGFWVVGALKESGREEVREQWKASALKEADEARQAVAKAQAEAEKEKEAAKQARDEKDQTEREWRQKNQETRASVEHDLRSRYERALLQNQECATWSKQYIACPVQ